MEQSQISVTAKVTRSAVIFCKVSSTTFDTETIYWYRQKSDQTLEHLIQIASIKSPVYTSFSGKRNKAEAKKDSQTSSSTLTINFLEKDDTATYYCAGWSHST